ncbi:hypothetical protein BE17_46970 [Sorangium cellulosum]|uniref:Uncharacterized protein n=1 Tax=Sorangium cellulosum TaxID=56 RepID=A0A150SJG2_SORCE|nr:hypothetical protein BE17_46970 [Sorangium cellulosum]
MVPTTPPQLPLRDGVPENERESIPAEILDETAYRELLEACTRHGDAALALFREIRDRAAGKMM